MNQHHRNEPEFLMGKRAGAQGLPRKAPHGPSTPSARAWFAGYDEGVLTAVRNAGETDKHDRSATPTRRDETQMY